MKLRRRLFAPSCSTAWRLLGLLVLLLVLSARPIQSSYALLDVPESSPRHRQAWPRGSSLSPEPPKRRCSPSLWSLSPSISGDDGAVTATNAVSVQPSSPSVDCDGADCLATERQLRSWGAWNPYRSQLLESDQAWDDFVDRIETSNDEFVKRHGTKASGVNGDSNTGQMNTEPTDQSTGARWCDPFWEQVKLEATVALRREPEMGPVLYQSVLLQPGLLEAVVSVIANEIETELIRAPALRSLFLELLTIEDGASVRLDLVAAATRNPSKDVAPFAALDALLHHNGFHALVCYRVGHRLWKADRTALAYYLQSAVSRKYAADIHPSCQLGKGTYLTVGGGVVIGETAVVGDDACILEGVTLGGTGKEAGDRHPKVGRGVVIQDGGTVLGNIPVGDGALVTAKSIVTKPVPPLAIVSGVPARIQGYRQLTAAEFDDDLQRHLAEKYLDDWKERYGSSLP